MARDDGSADAAELESRKKHGGDVVAAILGGGGNGGGGGGGAGAGEVIAALAAALGKSQHELQAALKKAQGNKNSQQGKVKTVTDVVTAVGASVQNKTITVAGPAATGG